MKKSHFRDKLILLMDLYKVSNSQLARGINVDASLISRWRSGQRVMAANSPHVTKIAEYFVQFNAFEYQRQYLDDLIQSHLTDKDEVLDEHKKILILSKWFMSADLAHPINPGLQQKQIKQSQNLIRQIASLLSSQPAEMLSPAVPAKNSLSPCLSKIESGDSFTGRKYRGYAGRRAAVLAFLEAVLQMKAATRIFLISEDKTDWMTEDAEFTKCWANLLQQVIQNGHDITVIHTVKRDEDEITKLMYYWMPLHLTGHLHSYYLPMHNRRQILQTLFIAENGMTIHSQTISGEEQDGLTYLTEDPDINVSSIGLFRQILSNCRPLFILYQRRQVRKLLDDVLNLQSPPAPLYSLRDYLNFLTLPPSLAETITPLLNGQTGGLDVLEVYRRHHEKFILHLQSAPYIDIYPLSLLEDIAKTGQLVLHSNELFMHTSYKLSADQSLCWLKHLLSLLRSYPHYQICFTASIPHLKKIAVNITFKEGTVSLFSRGQASNQMIIRLDEANVLQALSSFFADFMSHIPAGQKDKPSVISRLEQLIRDLAGDESAE